MTSLNKSIIVGLTALTLVFGVLYTKSQQVIKVTVTSPEQSQSPSFGAVPTLDGVDNPFVSIGGLRQYYYSQPMAATSSVACSIKNPFNATSTVLNYTAALSANRLGAQQFDVSTSTTVLGSSTPALIRVATGAALIPGAWAWLPNSSSTATLLDTNLNGTSPIVLAPYEYLNLRYSTGTPSAFTTYNTGRCSGVIQAL